MSGMRRKKHKMLRFLISLIILLLLISIGGILYLATKNFVVTFTPGDYSASNEQLNNPYCGWFHTYAYNISDDMVFDAKSVSNLTKEDNNTRLCQLDFDLSAYAEGGISQEGMQRIDSVIAAWEHTNKKLLLRFSYLEDPADISTVYLHMEQVADVVNDHANSIYALRGCFVSADGIEEQQAEELMEYVSSLTVDDIPVIWEEALNSDSTISDIAQARATFLDADGNAELVERWKNETYRESDVFSGVTTYDYIASHLGYRYRVTSSQVLFDTWKQENGVIEIGLVNEGFAAAKEQFDATILLKNKKTEEEVYLPLKTDNRDWKPLEQIKITNALKIKELEKGTYSVYFIMIDSKSGEVIHLGNAMSLTSNGYQIGVLQVQ